MSAVTTAGPYFRDELRGPADIRYFYTGAEGPALKSHDAAILRYLDDKSLGETGRAHAEVELDRCRTMTAQLLGGAADRVAVMGNSSDALHRLVSSIEYRPGDNVVTTDLEFPSGVLSLLALRERGVEVRIIAHDDWMVEPKLLRRHVDARTRVVIASHVSYLSGTKIDAPAFRDIAHEVGAAFILDATQSLGVIQVRESDADAIVVSTYKWLLGPHGMGLMYVTDFDRFPGTDGAGWRSVRNLFGSDRFERIDLFPGARRFELGYPSFPSAYLLADSLALITSVAVADLEKYTLDLSDALIGELTAAGFGLLTPTDRARHGTNVSAKVEGDATAAADRLLKAGIRAWGGDGRVRFSVHGFLTADDIEAAASGLRRAL